MSPDQTTVEVRPIRADELDRYIELCQTAFGGKPEEGEHERITDVIGLDRTHGAFDGDRMVGTDGSYTLHLTVPGTDPGPAEPDSADHPSAPPAGVRAGGLTRVSVAATHRRRGVLTGLIAAHFADAAERGELLSVLWASELPIYGRFGYGPASDALRVSYDNRQAGIREPEAPDRVTYAEGEEAAELLPVLRERDRLTRPGHYHRTEAWWRLRCFPDHEFWREGASPRRTVIAWRGDRAVGYATFRQFPRWTEHDLPDGEIRVIESVGLDRSARHSLWWFLSNIDLHPRVGFWGLPLDSELPWLAANQRAVIRHHTDGLQARVLDVIGALEARRWVEPGQLAFSIDDRHHRPSAGGYRLTVDDDGRARVERSDEEPEVRLHPAALGGLYLGSRSPEAMAVAGWLSGDPEAIERTRRLFAWPVSAWCDELF